MQAAQQRTFNSYVFAKPRLELTAREIVKDQDRGGAVVQGSPKKFSRIDGRLSARTEAELVAANQPVPSVNTEKAENLAPLHLQPAQQILAHNRRVTEDLGFSKPGTSDSVAELEAGEDGGGLGGTDAVDAEELGGVPPGELRKAAGGDQEGVGLDHRTPTTPAGSHQHRKQLGV